MGETVRIVRSAKSVELRVWRPWLGDLRAAGNEGMMRRVRGGGNDGKKAGAAITETENCH